MGHGNSLGAGSTGNTYSNPGVNKTTVTQRPIPATRLPHRLILKRFLTSPNAGIAFVTPGGVSNNFAVPRQGFIAPGTNHQFAISH